MSSNVSAFPMNNHARVARVRPLFDAYVGLADEVDEAEALIDLVVDLGHLADTFGVDFGHLLALVRLHLDAERAGDEPW